MNKFKDYFKGTLEVTQTVNGEDQVRGDVPMWVYTLMQVVFTILTLGLSRVLADGLVGKGLVFIAKINGRKK